MTRYRLRAGVRLVRDAAGRAVLQDRDFRRGLRLGPDDARLVAALAGKGGRADELRRALGAAAAELEVRLSALARLYVLDGPRAALALQLQHPPPPALASLADSIPLHWPGGVDPPRHRCVSRGACCSSSFLGPMTGPDRVRVEGLRMGARSRVRDGVDAIELLDHAGQTYVGMARVGGRCVAQGDDALCDIHAEHGMATKPVPCRQFPLRFHRSSRGLHVSLLLACEGYAEGRAEQRDPWPSREAEVRTLLAEGAQAVTVAAPGLLSLGVPAADAAFWGVVDAMVAASEAAADAFAALVAATEVLHVRALAHAETLREGPQVSTPARVGDLAPMVAGVGWDRDVLEQQAAGLRGRAADLAGRDEPADARRLDRLAAVIVRLGDPALAEVELDAVAARLLRDVVANDLPAAVAVGPLDEGLLALARRLTVASTDARMRAQEAGRRRADGADATLALKLVARSEHDVAALALARHP